MFPGEMSSSTRAFIARSGAKPPKIKVERKGALSSVPERPQSGCERLSIDSDMGYRDSPILDKKSGIKVRPWSAISSLSSNDSQKKRQQSEERRVKSSITKLRTRTASHDKRERETKQKEQKRKSQRKREKKKGASSDEEPEPWFVTQIRERGSDSSDEEEQELRDILQGVQGIRRRAAGETVQDESHGDTINGAHPITTVATSNNYQPDQLALPKHPRGYDSDSDSDRPPTPATRSRQSFEAWLEGPEVLSEEYDTDLDEEKTQEELEKASDATGKYVYRYQCNRYGVVPVSYIMRNLGERHIRMRHHYIGGYATRPLASAFKKNTVIEMLDLGDNYIEDEGAVQLSRMLKENMFIVQLDISDNFIRHKGAAAIAEMLDTNTTLKTLILKGNHLTDGAAKILGEALKTNMSLMSLDLSHNEFGELGGKYLGAGLAANEYLADIDLSWNSIRQKGGEAIANALKTNHTLEILDLSWNGLALNGATALMKSLKVNTRLKVLDLGNNRINAQAAQKLSLGIAKNTGLETVFLNFNPLGDKGVEAVVKAVTANTGIKMLSIEDITLNPAVYQKVRTLEVSGRDIIVLHSGIGGYQKSRAKDTILALFERFINENAMAMEDLFTQLDKDKSGDVTLDEMKYGLKEAGLRLTNKQIDDLLDMLDADKSGTIEYSELLGGENMVKQQKEKRQKMSMMNAPDKRAMNRRLRGMTL